VKEINLTEGPIFTKLVQFSLPMIAGNLLQQVYNLVDTLIVGKCIGSDALAAVGSAYTLMTFLTSILIGLCMGSGAFFSADYGAGEEDRLGEDIRLSFGFILAMCALIYAIIYPGMELILSLLQTPPELLELTRNYVRPVFTGIFFVFLYNFYAYLLRAVGNSLIPLIFLGISALLNIVLDLWFVPPGPRSSPRPFPASALPCTLTESSPFCAGRPGAAAFPGSGRSSSTMPPPHSSSR